MAIKEENSIGYRIIGAFGAKDLKEVANTIDENYSSLHNWSSGRRDFPTNVLIKIANLANTSIDWILTGEDRFKTIAADDTSFERMFEEKIRAIVRREIAEGAAIHEKIQGVILAMQPNIEEQNLFEASQKTTQADEKEEKAA
jgi:hypothetical protein